ncbi:MAG: zinc-binding dehydrogenase [candidate division Zixibacteria bacterium]|nr:zinc-binding dehydrogenase [candidate division Zixibacteria bacterium]
MTAAVLYGKQDVRIERVEVPAIGDGDVLVRVRAALTCGTDAKVYRRGYHARMIVPPSVFGHELAGEIVAVGGDVQGFAPGMRVVAANSAPCQSCFYCRRHQENLCENLLFINGAYAEYIRIPEQIVRHNLLEIPGHVSFRHAALIEPLACVLHGLEETGVQRHDTVAVIGTGPIGLMFVRMAKLRGAYVIAIGRRINRLRTAADMGADVVIDAAETPDIVEAVRVLSNEGRGADRVVEAVGQPESWEQAIRMVRPGGTVNAFGGCPSQTKIQLDADLLHYSEITVKGTFHHTPRMVKLALRLVADGAIDVDALVTREAPLAQLPGVLEAMMGKNGAMKTAILP